MRQVNMHEAKTHLSRLVEEAAAGEAFVICKAGRPMVRVTALDDASNAAPQRRRLGLLRGRARCPTTSIGWLPARSRICSRAPGRVADRRHASAVGYTPGGVGDGITPAVANGPGGDAGRSTQYPGVLLRALLDGGWQELAIEARHALAMAQLPPLHRDPFDRLLLAQATADGPVQFMAAAVG